jgi:hypothetical protein
MSRSKRIEKLAVEGSSAERANEDWTKMSLSPQHGQGAPTGVDVDPTPPARHASAANQPGSGYPPGPDSAPSPTWGSTSTVQGGGTQAAPEPAFPPPAANRPDTPTASVTYPPPGAPARPPMAAPAGNPPANSARPGPAAGGRGQRGARARGPRRARLQLRHIDAWTVLKFSCVLSIALFFVWLIVVGVLFGVLDATGIIEKINDSITTINGGNAKPPVTPGIVFGGAAIIGVVNIVLFIAITTIGSVVYNLCADLVGGIEVTLSER